MRTAGYVASIVVWSSLGIQASAEARPTYPATIPTPFSCATCHVNPRGGGTRNAFGQEYERGRSWANVFDVDSDGDGFTNGEELGDPDGLWAPRQPLPQGGTPTRPADPLEFPVCGDGTLHFGEACDDGNDVGGDGCDSDCIVESGFVCVGAPSTCTMETGPSDDVGVEVGEDVAFDVGVDAGSDADPDTGRDVGVDTQPDLGLEVGVDGGGDVGVDTDRETTPTPDADTAPDSGGTPGVDADPQADTGELGQSDSGEPVAGGDAAPTQEEDGCAAGGGRSAWWGLVALGILGHRRRRR